jgi:hypothetical protein
MRTSLYLAAIGVSLAAVTATGISAAQNERKPPQLRREVAAAAADVHKALVQRMEAGEAMTPTFVELMFEWSRRVYQSAVAADAGKDARAQAAREHLERVTDLYRTLNARFGQGLDVSRVQAAQATYYLREAELWVAEAQAR